MFCPCYYRMIYIKKSILLTNEKFLLGTTRITCLQNKLISRGKYNQLLERLQSHHLCCLTTCKK